MKIELRETEYGFDFILTPETVGDVSTLWRLTKHTLLEAPHFGVSIGHKEPTGYVSLSKKKNRSKLKSCISGKTKID